MSFASWSSASRESAWRLHIITQRDSDVTMPSDSPVNAAVVTHANATGDAERYSIIFIISGTVCVSPWNFRRGTFFGSVTSRIGFCSSRVPSAFACLKASLRKDFNRSKVLCPIKGLDFAMSWMSFLPRHSSKISQAQPIQAGFYMALVAITFVIFVCGWTEGFLYGRKVDIFNEVGHRHR